ncbi:MAG: HD domain-containing protein [Oligoflexia bacterium]|nr:HD domain-containing protein [Oligoflexia bacterium]
MSSIKRILVSDPNPEYKKIITRIFDANTYTVDFALTGQEVQAFCHKKEYQIIILDLATQDHSAFTVLKYLKSMHPSLKIFFTIPDKKNLSERSLNEKDIMNAGANNIIYKPYNVQSLLSILSKEFHPSLNASTSPSESEKVGKELKIKDDLFTKIKIDEFFSGSSCIFDLFARLKKDHYVKMLEKGNYFDSKRITEFIKDKKIDYFYFLTKERNAYIVLMNKIIEKSISMPQIPIENKIKNIKNISEKILEEIHAVGLKNDLVEEGKKLCQQIHELVSKEKELYKTLSLFKEISYSCYYHSFLVSFLATLICKQLEWGANSTIINIILGGMLHDIGKLKLKMNILVTPPWKLDSAQFEIYKNHPIIGVKLLEKFPIISNEISQIVLQHHETINRKGFPNGIGGAKLYLPAQIIGFVDTIANLMINNQVEVKKAFALFIEKKENTELYDGKIIAAFYKCLT